jgi:hypothetical protein
MKKITLCFLSVLFFAFSSYAQTVVVTDSSPYYENFESGAGGWFSAGGFPNEWQLGTPSPTNTEITLPAPGGVNSWVTDLGNGVAPSNGDGLYENSIGANVFYRLLSPIFDFSGISSQPVISFDFWCDLEFASSFFYDGARLQYSLDGGTTWQTLGSTTSGGTNWYNADIEAAAGFQGWSGSNDNNDTDGIWEPLDGESTQGWVRASHPLPCAVIGNNNVRFRFEVVCDDIANFDGFGVDNISISSSPTANIALGLFAPVSGVNLSGTENLTVTVTNLGNTIVTSLLLNVAISGPISAVFSETVSLSSTACPPSGPVNVTLTTPIDMSLFGFYNISVTAVLPGDVDNSNNTVTVWRENRRRVTAFPYSENFEGTTNNGWYIVPTQQVGATEWTLASPPSKSFINSAASPTRAWVTGASGKYGASVTTMLISPIFDLSSFNAANRAILSFDRILDIAQDGDRLQVLYTTNPANTPTTNLDDAAWAGVNWHNLANGFDGLKQGWRPSRELLTQVFGQANVRFAFLFVSNGNTANDGDGAGIDNIFIGSTGLTDLAVTQLISPTTGANKILPQTVTVRLENVGAGAISGATMKYKISGPNGIQNASQSVTFGTPIATGNSQNFTFATQANLSFIGTYEFEVDAEVIGDVYTPNNKVTKLTGGSNGTGHPSLSVTHEPLAAVCRLDENFNGTTGSTPPTGWTQNTIAGGAFDTWRFNNPGARATPIGMTAPFAIFDSDNYSNPGGVENVALNSPSMNFSGLQKINMNFRYWFLDGFDGRGFVELSDNGGTSWTKIATVGTGNATGETAGGTILPFQTAGTTTTSTAPLANLNISALAANKPNVRARFRWTGDWSWYWMLDNVSICATEAPINLSAEGGYRKVINAFVDSVKVQWEDLSSLENGFILQRATDTTGIGNWEVIAGVAQLPTNSTSYIDFAVFPNTRYYYRVQYSYAGGLSEYSNVGSAIIEREENQTPPYVPVLTATADYQKAHLSWTKPLPEHGIKRFEVYFGIEVDGVPSNPNVRIANIEDTKFTAIGLVNGFNYSFIVKPVLGDGKYYENLSNIAYARPSVILGEDDLSKQFSFNVYPNPNNGTFTLNLEGKQSEKLNVKIVNVAGQEVYSNNFGSFNGYFSETIDLNNVASGLYIVTVETDGGMIQRKVSINR